MTDRQSQRLDFAVCRDGSVQMKHHDCDVTAIGPISRDQFTDDKIEIAIADLLDRLVPQARKTVSEKTHPGAVPG
jgi:hypothetical protein